MAEEKVVRDDIRAGPLAERNQALKSARVVAVVCIEEGDPLAAGQSESPITGGGRPAIDFHSDIPDAFVRRCRRPGDLARPVRRTIVDNRISIRFSV